MLTLPPECWAEKNTHLSKTLELLHLTSDVTFFLNLVRAASGRDM